MISHRPDDMMDPVTGRGGGGGDGGMGATPRAQFTSRTHGSGGGEDLVEAFSRARHGRCKDLDALFNKGVYPGARDVHGLTLLHMARRAGAGGREGKNKQNPNLQSRAPPVVLGIIEASKKKTKLKNFFFFLAPFAFPFPPRNTK